MQRGPAGGPGGGPAAPTPIHPIDHGWAWMIVLGAFGINFFVNGGLRTIGIFIVNIIKAYHVEPGVAAMLVSLLAGCYALFSPVGNAIAMLSTVRSACLTGCVLMFLGLFFVYLAANAIIVIVSMGILCGLGYAFIFGPSLVIVSQHFKVRMSLANGLASAGGSVGTLVIPLILQWANDEYGFQGGTLVYAAVILHAIPASLLLRPITQYRKRPRVPVSPPTQPDVNENSVGTSKTDKRVSGVFYELVGSQIMAKKKGASTHEAPVADQQEVVVVPVETGTNNSPGDQKPGGAPPKVSAGMFIRIFCQRLCDKTLLTDYSYICYVLGLAIGQCGYINAVAFLPSYSSRMWPLRAKEFIIVFVGISDLVGRVAGGWFADLDLIRKPFLVGFTFVVSGAATILMPLFYKSYSLFVIYALILGTLAGTYQALQVVILAESYGPARTASGFGFMSMVMGLLIVPISPILGTLARTQGLAAVLRVCGLLLFIGGLFFYAFPFAQKSIHKKRTAAAAAQGLLMGNIPVATQN